MENEGSAAQEKHGGQSQRRKISIISGTKQLVRIGQRVGCSTEPLHLLPIFYCRALLKQEKKLVVGSGTDPCALLSVSVPQLVKLHTSHLCATR